MADFKEETLAGQLGMISFNLFHSEFHSDFCGTQIMKVMTFMMIVLNR